MMWLSQIAQWTGGTLIGEDHKVSAVVTDTRDMAPGCLFVALKGERWVMKGLLRGLSVESWMRQHGGGLMMALAVLLALLLIWEGQ